MGKKKKRNKEIEEQLKNKKLVLDYDINYFLDMHKKLQYDPNGKDIQFPRTRSKKKYF